MTQHAGLTEERWSAFDLDQQVLMIANEMNRVRKLPDGDGDGRRRAYERVLRLTDLTLATSDRGGLLKELARWRDLVAALFLSDTADPERHGIAFRALLRLRPLASRQIPHLLG